MPEQLQTDLLRTASLMGFTDQVSAYEKQFKFTYKPEPALAGGELVVFVENGLAPYKKEDNYFFTLIKNEGGFFFTDNNKAFMLPVDFSVGIDATNLSLKDVGIFRLALPSYVVRPMGNSQFEATADGKLLNGQKIQDINYVATHVLSERTLKEMSLALSRLLLKKLAEKVVKDKNDAAGQILQAVNFLVEKADTRNWQSLPANIYYLRIPLKMGEQQVQLTSGGNSVTTITVTGDGGMQFYNYRKM
jgi:hypothetical protein